MSDREHAELWEPLDARALADRALRAIAAAAIRRVEYQSVQMRLLTAVARAKELRDLHAELWGELRRTIESVAHGERVAGRRPEEMLVLIKGLVEGAGLDVGLKHEIEPDVVRWGIDAYYAA